MNKSAAVSVAFSWLKKTNTLYVLSDGLWRLKVIYLPQT